MARSRNVTRTLFIYRTLLDRDVLALQLELDDKGKVSLVPGKERGDEAMRVVGSRVEAPDGSYVTPKDGERPTWTLWSQFLGAAACGTPLVRR